jgi:integrase
MRTQWKCVRNTWIATTPVLPGVWQRREGGFVVRGRKKDPRTGRRKEIWKVMPEADQATAYAWLKAELDRVRRGIASAASEKVPFATYAVSLLKRKVESGDIESDSGIEKWGNCLEHLIASNLGDLYVDEIRTSDCMAWRSAQAAKVDAGTYAPTTVNTWLSVLKVAMKHVKLDFDLPANVAKDVPPLDTTRRRVYTHEEPNSLEAKEASEFLACMRSMYPQFFAMTYLGFATGLRPSSMRPIRRKGPHADVLWDELKLLIRQSNSRGTGVMVGTKTGGDEVISVPKELLAALRWHVDTQLNPGPQTESDLLFPSELGGFRSRSCLDKPFRDVAEEIGLKKHFTPRGMRRSFQDLARAAEVRDVVTRSISGHATDDMQRHYSTVSAVEQKESLAKVLRLIDHPRRRPSGGASGGA